ncbi:MAG: zinc-ribbon domain-containing protein [Bryobacteraceae bacterium]
MRPLWLASSAGRWPGKPLRAKTECPKCGTHVEAGTKFCPECGNKMV